MRDLERRAAVPSCIRCCILGDAGPWQASRHENAHAVPVAAPTWRANCCAGGRPAGRRNLCGGFGVADAD